MTQSIPLTPIQDFLAQTFPFDQLSTEATEALTAKCQLMRYRVGQSIFVREKMPAHIAILYQGQARLLGYDQRTRTPVSLELLGSGRILGASSLVRGIPCETAIASSEVICITIASQDFLDLLNSEPSLEQAFLHSSSLSEVFELLSVELQRSANETPKLKELATAAWQDAIVRNIPKGKLDLAQLDSQRIWLVSSGSISDFPVGSRLPVDGSSRIIRVEKARLLGLHIREQINIPVDAIPPSATHEVTNFSIPPVEIPYAPEHPPEAPPDPYAAKPKYPIVRGRGTIEAPLACFQMLSQYLGLAFRKDLIRKVLENQFKSAGNISLQACGAITEMMGLRAQLVQVAATAINRLKAPALIRYADSFAVIYSITEKELVIAIPESGILRKSPQGFAEIWGKEGQVLLLQAPSHQVKEKFSLRWFLPSISRYRKVLTEVLIASLFVQLFGLANPLITQVIIDKVLVQRSIDTLDVLGIFLLGVAVFEALLTSVRTYLFVDTTNRIDLSLGSEVIDHLLRLPLKYFDRRRIGELAGRINELENIRQFLTGTALTVVLDAVFSVIYVAVMLFYSWLLTLVTLVTIPLFALLTIFVSPIVRRQLHKKAEKYADTQSYLVEVLSGIQTVKAQNIELKSRWQWQERYAKYISAGFNNVLTFSTASSISGFLNKFTGLLLLWVGAHLVLANQLTLGQLIAFRIIAGYVTSPLLRLIQLWQNFQETALSIERLSDVLDAPQEVDETNRNNIPMPEIKGDVHYDELSFGFNSNGPLQLINVNLEISAGSFVGVVGQSGSGKSTLAKLLQRLYEPTSGRIQIDRYDISKVELYSLRRQIGVVLQDTLLFNGTVQENIALTNPEASSDEVIAAAKIAVAHDFIMSLPQGYNTIVGERGSSLSGGQRQRIAIARTVLQNPKLLILDEATSALDYNSERQVCNNLSEAFQGKTVFFITHRLSTVRNADTIVVMDQGSIVEQGTHQELMALKGRYYCLYQQQESQL
ncbi:type I secretion system permease/ATPase [Gloeocapsopsis dulcis]|uniref:Type I secretion system permease/ATPase n=1 Tax=Gloeocapsopsis dulcis AAB1 = 1H9 TaxID=1433147 RepID=A0A6N8FVM8_9CHRO|nr:peptidase domain-containing ABC transporter [Gloeocapsopsis dulcis]MUL36006.1 type I secretion system permease/ATPase [Gloeocapsopsis dulcis AAB1 = 1H9]WNN88259.1 peptidase domain-containing ABC transporter [Gloeocapsopsis dulcis]